MPHRFIPGIALFLTLLVSTAAWGQAPQPLLLDFDRLLPRPAEVTGKDNKQVPAGTAVPLDGRFGKACKFSFVESTGPQFFTAFIRPAENWDEYEGFSFWLKGDGSKNFGGLEFIDAEDYAMRYGYCFPIESTEWIKITVPWSELMPELASPLVDAGHHAQRGRGVAPSRFRNLFIGKWFYWREHPACSFTIERLALEKHVARGAPAGVPKEPGLPRVLAKLKAKQPVTMVTMGDSLTDKRHWANHDKLWAEELVKRLKAAYGSEVTLVNPAIGGTTLSQNIVLMPRWLRAAPQPDLVIIWFGGNDWDGGVRGQRFKEYLEVAVDRIRRDTKGQAEVLIMTTCPGFAAWDTRNELCQAACEVARERKTGFVDAAGAFHRAGSREEALKRKYWAWDNVHLGPGGHDLIVEIVAAGLASGGAEDLKQAAGAAWMKVPPAWHAAADGETPLSGFEPGQGMVEPGAGTVVKEHASEGAYSLRLVSKADDYPGFSIQDGVPLRLVHENSRVLLDVFNPQPADVDVQLLVRDPQATNFNLRYNGAVTVKPGKNTIDVDYTRLPRYATQKNAKPDYLDARQLTLIGFFLIQPAGGRPITLYFDNIRLARQATGKIEVRPGGAPPANTRSPLPPGEGPGVRATEEGQGVRAAEPQTMPPGPAPAGSFLLSSFEPGGPAFVEGDGQPVREHATDGQYALKVQSDAQAYRGIRILEGVALRKFKDYVLLKVDIFNPQDRPVHCGARIDDAATHDYGSRYNDDEVIVPPGKSTFEINLTGLTKSNARNFSERQKLDVASARLMALCMGPSSQPTTLYFDNIRLEGSGLPKVAGLRAIDFGPPGSPVYPGFEGCTNEMVYTPSRGCGWIAPDYAMIAYMPDALTGDCASGREFRMDLPNGSYEVHVCWDMFGLWGTLPSFEWRKLLINGREVLSEKRTAAEFLANYYYAHEDDEDLPGQDLWEKFIASYQKIHRFTVQVGDGLLRIEPQASHVQARGLCFVVVYPESRQAAGREFMAVLAARRKARFNADMVVHVEGGAERATMAIPASDEDRRRGFVAFAAHTEDDLGVNAAPGGPARPRLVPGTPLRIEAAQGERQAAQLGLFPLAELHGVSVSAGDLVRSGQGANAGPPSTIPAAAIRVRKVRNFLKGEGHGRLGNLLPYILQDFQALDLRPGVTRALWLTVAVPESAAPGSYAGSIHIAAGQHALAIPIELIVHPFRLDRVKDITISATGSTAGIFPMLYPELDDRWWQIAEMVMRDQAEHGMNAVTGGPGAKLRGIRDGQADIDYRRMDRWMALAVKYGLTMPGDSYQGLDVEGLPTDHSRDCVARCEAAARRQFGVSYEELLRIVYGDLERHARKLGWPKRVYYFLDEPRPEYGNVQACAEMIKVRTRACPDTLFSGYYSTGDGRDVYFQSMPVSIAHIDKLSLELVGKGGKQIWDYDGTRVRYDIGRWAFVAARAGMKGFLRNGYMYVCSMPYFDFSDDEASWSVVYPSRHGINDTVGWERTAQGVNDYRYLLTCERLVREARRGGKAVPEAGAAAAFLAETLRPIAIERKESARLSAAGYDDFRRRLAAHIAALGKICEKSPQ
jgi:lysophospholipase L1-like esterase